MLRKLPRAGAANCEEEPPAYGLSPRHPDSRRPGRVPGTTVCSDTSREHQELMVHQARYAAAAVLPLGARPKLFAPRPSDQAPVCTLSPLTWTFDTTASASKRRKDVQRHDPCQLYMYYNAPSSSTPQSPCPSPATASAVWKRTDPRPVRKRTELPGAAFFMICRKNSKFGTNNHMPAGRRMQTTL